MPPSVSVLTAVHDPDRAHLEACLASVAAQTFADWEHVIVDDGSTMGHVRDVLAQAAADPRVRVIHRERSGGIVAASTDALDAAVGEIVALLDHDDVLEPDALAVMHAAIADGADVAYSDHDLLTPEGHCSFPYLKPDFSPEQLRNQNYLLHFVAARRSVVVEVGGFRPGFDGAQDHDLLLRISERSDRIVHVPEVLYHWRQSATSVAADPSAKTWAYDAGVRAVQEHCDRTGIGATVEPGTLPGVYRVRRRLDDPPRVSVVIPTRGSARRVWGVTRCFVVEAVRSLLDHSTYPDLEVVVVYDTPTPKAVLDHLRLIAGDRLVLVEYTAEFNFSDKINVGVAAGTGELVLLLNDDTQLITPDAIETMAAHLLDDGVGMVGPKLLFADGTVQDAGHVYNEHVLPSLVGWHGTSPGPPQLRPLAVERECSGVTAAAAMVRRAVFDEVGGLDPVLWMNFNDVDFSLKIRRTGRRVIWTPHASWYHFESQTRAPTAEPREFAEIDGRWHDEINRDPYYHPDHAPRRADWLERPWHSGFPPVDQVDTTQSTRAWAWERLRGASVSGHAVATRRRTAALVAALVAATVTVAVRDDGPGVLAGMVATGLPIALWASILALAVFRARWALVGAIAIAPTPAVVGVLARGDDAGFVWMVWLVVGVVVGPLWRRRPWAVAVLGAACLALAAVSGAGTSDDSGWSVVLDVIGRAGADGTAWGVAAVVVWLVGFFAVVAFAWDSGERVWSGIAALTLPVLSIVGAPAAVGVLAGVTIVAGARVDHEAPHAARVAGVACAAAFVTWACVTVGALTLT